MNNYMLILFYNNNQNNIQEKHHLKKILLNLKLIKYPKLLWQELVLNKDNRNLERNHKKHQLLFLNQKQGEIQNKEMYIIYLLGNIYMNKVENDRC